MAKARAIVIRRKAVQNIRKITRTMELIATARFKKALDRATEAEAYTRKIAELVADLGASTAARRPAAPAAGGPRDGQERPAPASPDQQPWAWPAATTATSSRIGHRAPSGLPDADGSPGRHRWRSRSKRDQLFREVPGHRPADATSRSSRTGRSSTRSRSWPSGTSASTRRGRSTGWRSPTPSSLTRRVDEQAVVETLSADDRRASVGQAGPSVRQSKRRARKVPRGSRGGPLADRACLTEFLPDARSILEEIVPGLVQAPPLPVLPRRGGQRADRPGWSPCAGRRPRTPTT